MQSLDQPGVIAPPPLLAAGFLAVGVALDFGLLRLRTGLPGFVLYAIAAALTAGAVLLAASALRLFRRAETNVEPWKPATALVTTGVYGRTRNPMYVSLILVFLAVSVAADSLVSVAMLIPFLAVLRYGVIGREERYLDAKFGEDYRRYRARVRRWL